MPKAGWFKWCSCSVCAVVVAFALAPVNAGNEAGQGLPNLVRANERFGRSLLVKVHKGDPGHNVVVSPVSLTIVLAAIQHASSDAHLRKEIGDAFGWGEYPSLGVPVRMLLAAFEEPTRVTTPPPPRARPVPRGFPKGLSLPLRSPEESWITNVLLFRGTDPSSGQDLNALAQEFVADASKYFGVKFVSTGAAKPTANDLRGARKSAGALPLVSSKNDVWISSGVHLRTAWKGNTFAMNPPFTGEFRTARGEKRQVEMNTSELSQYPHAMTNSFEAVVLPCQSAYMVAVLPAPGKDILELEKDLADSPETLDAVLEKQAGLVTMPTFHIGSERDLRPQLEEMGIRQVFEDLAGMVRFPKSHLREVAQKIDLRIDHEGIRANAETVAGAVYGGVMSGTPFKMQIDRPFLFLVRDYNTNALLFMGVVMDPSQNP